MVDFLFLLEARPPPLVPFFDDDSPDTLSLPTFSSFFIFFSYCLIFSAIIAATCWVMNLPMSLASIKIPPSNSTAVSSVVLVMFWPFSSFDILSSISLNWYCCMKPPQHETKMISRVVLSFIYRAASINASGWGGGSLTAGLAEKAMLRCRLTQLRRISR